MTMSSPLLGPPELRDSNPLLPKPITASGPRNPFMDLMVENFNYSINLKDPSSPQKGLTENGAGTYLSAGNPCLDFFFHVVPSTPKKSLEERLQLAWDHDPLTTLKLICNLRGVRGTGKSDKEGFYTAALWLHESLSKFGYFKDFPEILYRILKGSKIRDTQKSERMQGKSCRGRGRRVHGSRKRKTAATRELRVATAEMKNQADKAIASINRKLEKISVGKEAFTRYSHDAEYRFLHERVSDLFSDLLRRDVEFLTSGETNKISLAAKWCPSIDSSRTLQLPEVYMGAKAWGSLPYNRVASVAMKSYKEIFLSHDEERFKKYLEDAKSGKTKIAAGALLPHEIIGDLEGGDGGQVAELQWKRMVDDMRTKGSLTNCIAISDVSGSMEGTPMEVSVALGLLVSELADEPWRGKLITFSGTPELHLVEGDDLRSKTQFVRDMDWGANTDFQKVFDLILKVAVEGKLKPEEMIRRVFVFSDMEFDEASSSSHSRYNTRETSSWETNYQVIVSKYEEKGYGGVVPEIVFWNLRDSKSTPVTRSDKGVALVSGFSKNLIKMFLDNDGEIDPMTIMHAVISGPEYNELVVID
ncbi:unnamed protein product [Brassica napus]|uniref:(rape) hypothetical protein n=1 Tax=Brassica napus TaxID=3708 RepID=A0A816P0W1_BRANA|nr:unnamed protein product [Brassica napus]